jgi:phosphohistidine phosphatase
MRTLLVLRHGKSSRKHTDISDHDRPLSKRGKRDTPRVGQWLRSRRLSPDAIVSSTAKRARHTAEEVAQSSGFKGRIQLEPRLYLADPETIVDVVRWVETEAQRVLVVGHNPGLEELVAQLTGHDEVFPTAALAQISLPVDQWKDLWLSIDGQLVNMWRPRE